VVRIQPNLRRWLWLALLLIVTSPHADVQAADDTPRNRDFWIGANATEGMWQIYSGGTLAPFGHIQADGWRLRAGGGFGQYTYSGERGKVRQSFAGNVTYLDVMAGYQTQWGPLTAKAFLGLATIEHRVFPLDPDASAGRQIGPKLQTELWYDAGNGYWVSLNASYTTAHDTYAVRARNGLRVTPEISLGPELEITDTAVETTDLEAAYTRGGAFATYSWGSGEVSASGGVAGDIDGDVSPYVTLNIYTHF
jgi:hypothetical protein